MGVAAMISETDRFLNADQVSLYECWWLPEGKPKATLIIIHGYGEHLGRYAHVAEYMVERGYAVGAFDLRGHGQSAEQRSYIESYDACVRDIIAFLGRVEDRYPYNKRFLLGHSMGGAIVAKFLIQQPNLVDGAILSGAGIRIAAPTPRLLRIASAQLSRFFPRLLTVHPKLEDLTHDAEIAALYENDPLGLVNTRIAARTGHELISHEAYFAEHAPAIELPLLILHGGADTVTDPSATRMLHDKVSSTDKSYHIFEGMFHELHNEIKRDEWMAMVGDWLDARV